MSYNPTSPEEQQFMADFQKNWPAIQEFRRQYPKESLEGAYYKVTGKQWMPGRSVELDNGQPVMSKDRTVKSVLGKYVAPIGAGALTALTMGGAAPVLAGLFGGGGAGAAGTAAGTSMLGGAGAGAGAGGILTGAGSLAAIPTLSSMTGAPITGASAAAPILGAGEASTTLGATGGLVPGLSGAAPTAGGTGSFMSKFLGKGGAPEKLADSASMLGNYAGAQANNRTEKANLGQNYDQARLQAQQDQRTNEADAMKKLAQTSYLMGDHPTPSPTTISLNGEQKTLPTFGFGLSPISEAQKQGASTLQEQLLKRLQPGGSYQPTDPAQYSKQNFGEKAANTGSLISSGLGFLKSIF